MNHAQFWGGAAAPYEIEQSLRFNGSSSYLSRTFGNNGSSRTWTYSGWIKKASFNDRSQPVLAVGNSSGSQNSFFGVPGNWIIGNAIIPGGGLGGNTIWEGLRRDYSAWYHWVLQKRSSTANDFRLYINGVQLATTNNSTSWNNFNSNITHYIGRDNYDPAFLGGYLAELHFVDNQILDHEDFGEFDANGVWRPIEYTGSYGTNGFYLKFDPSATNGIGHDHSGNGNNFTPTNFTTSGTGTDVMSDTPTNNWCTWNPLDSKRDDGSYNYPSNGNLFTRVNTAGNYSAYATNIGFLTSGKWYFEYVPVRGGNNASNFPLHKLTSKDFIDSSSNPTGVTMNCGTQDGDGGTYMVAIDMDNGYVYRGRNGTWSNSGDPTSGSSGTGSVASFTAGTPYRLAVAHRHDLGSSEATHNFGQRAFAYTVPTGYSTLNTSNLPAPSIKDGSKNFNTVLYTGDGNDGRTVTGVGFQPDFTWIKRRDGSQTHALHDVVRGPGNHLATSNTNAEVTTNSWGALSSFDSDGFTIAIGGNGTGDFVNRNTWTYASWNWLAGGTGSSNTNGSITSTVSANPTAGFSIVSYTGTGANATVGHGLGVAPRFVIVKKRSASNGWIIGHSSVGWGNYMVFDVDAAGANSTIWQDTAPTSTVFSVGTNTTVNGSSATFIAYCFAEVEGYSKFGSYTGNGSTDGPFVYCGFRPAWVMIKNYTNSGWDWWIHDTARDPYNDAEEGLLANSSSGTTTGQNEIDILSNGFKTRGSFAGTATNGSGNGYIFMAFAENPFGGSGVSPATAR